MLNRRRERIVRGFENILVLYRVLQLRSSYAVDGVDVIAGEFITSFDVSRINLHDSLNA